MTTPTAFLTSAYDGLRQTLRAVDDERSWTPTGCAGWSVRDLTHHCWSEAQRALVALHSPSDETADLDGTTYWVDWGSDRAGAAAGRRFTRVAVSLFLRWEQLRDEYDATARGAPRSLRDVARGQGRDPGARAAGGGAARQPGRRGDYPPPRPRRPPALARGPAPKAVNGAREVVDAVALEVAGLPFPAAWDDVVVIRVATGREEADLSVRDALGALADRVPLFS